jgi:alkylhydroperoxidase family enzyme
MPRIPYKSADTSEPRDVVEAIRQRRGGKLLHLDRLLLYSPAYAKGWNALLGAVRNELEVPAKWRELAICCVAALTGADYEFHHHAPMLLKAGGTPAQVEALRELQSSRVDPALFDATERALIQFTFEMTRSVAISDATFRAAAAALQNDQLVVELIAVIATYNMVARFLVALQIEPESDSNHS